MSVETKHSDKPYASSCVWVPYSFVPEEGLNRLREQCTTLKRGWKDAPDVMVEGYVDDEEAQMLGLPMDFGLKIFQRWEKEGHPIPALGRIKARRVIWPESDVQPIDDQQAVFWSEMLTALKKRRSVMALAPTGSGKTVAALRSAKTLNVALTAIVPDRMVMNGWIKNAKTLFNLSDDDIGVVGKGDWKDKTLRLCVINSAASKEMPDEFFSSSSMVVWDEAQNLGATTFCKSMFRFHARYYMAMTASEERKDKCHDVFLRHFGEPSVKHEGDALPCYAIIVERETDLPNSSNMHLMTMYKKLSKIDSRNAEIINIAKNLYIDDRCTIVFSHLVDHLYRLRLLAKEAGIPLKQMGFLTRQRPMPDGSIKAVSEKYLEGVKSNARIIFATYKFRAGIDIPRLDAGIEALPISEGIQPPGRIRRPLAGKRMPEWYSIADLGVPRLENSLRVRKREYLKSKMTIRTHGTQTTI